MDPSSLVVGSLYRVNINLPFDDVPRSHPFTTDRVMLYEGIDEDYTFGTSYIFSDETDLYGAMEKDKSCYWVFSRMTHVCANFIRDGRWFIHICRTWHDGTELLRVGGSAPHSPPFDAAPVDYST